VSWRLADADFVDSNMKTAGDLPGITTDYVPRRLFDTVFEGPRRILKAKICTTRADQILEWTRPRPL
jgi:hypothetical protein